MIKRPINDKIIVKPEDVPEKTPGGLIQQGITRPKHIEGDILMVGHKVETIKEGDRVLFDSHAAFQSDEFPEGAFMIRDIDVLAIIEA